MTTYSVNMNESTAEALSCEVLKQIKKDTTSGGVMEACNIILTYLQPYKDPSKEFKDSGFTDDFGISME